MINELYHYGVKGQRWGIRRTKAKFHKNKLMQDTWNKNIKDIDKFYDNTYIDAKKRR